MHWRNLWLKSLNTGSPYMGSLWMSGQSHWKLLTALVLEV